MKVPTGSSPAERRILINSFAVEEAMRASVEDDYSIEAPDRVITREMVEAALSRIARLAETALMRSRRPELAKGIACYELEDTDQLILSALRLVHDDDRVVAYRHGQESAGPLFSVGARVLAMVQETLPMPPFTADEDDEEP